MHPALIGRLTCLAIAAAAPLAAQVPVQSAGAGRTVVQQAQQMVREGRRADAADHLGRHLAEQPNDGRAWFYLGRVYLDDVHLWHRGGHPGDTPAPLLLEFAGAAMEQAHQLLADSGSVFRVLVAVERATIRIEESGWDGLFARPVPQEDLPLPPVLRELGRNIIASCPAGGILVSGSLAEVASVWGAQLTDPRDDIVLLRSDLYDVDPRYRARLAAAIGVDSALRLPAALAAASPGRRVCLGPAMDSLPGLSLHPSGMVLVTGQPAAALPATLTAHQFGLVGLAGSVWTASVREVYDLAARRDRRLCTLFANAERRNLPSIASCPQ